MNQRSCVPIKLYLTKIFVHCIRPVDFVDPCMRLFKTLKQCAPGLCWNFKGPEGELTWVTACPDHHISTPWNSITLLRMMPPPLSINLTLCLGLASCPRKLHFPNSLAAGLKTGYSERVPWLYSSTVLARVMSLTLLSCLNHWALPNSSMFVKGCRQPPSDQAKLYVWFLCMLTTSWRIVTNLLV